MPKKRPPKEVWTDLRLKVLRRDGFCCVRCSVKLTEHSAHIDHIQSGKLANNSLSNLRSLCRRCHVLRLDMRHRGMVASALRDGIIGADWRSQTWE